MAKDNGVDYNAAEYIEPIKHGGNWDADNNWKKLREKKEMYEATGKWKPTHWDGGKAGATHREGATRKVSEELYRLNYDRAFNKITEEEYKKRREELGE